MNPVYFEEYAVGDSFETSTRIITQEDINKFAELTGDFNPLHVDEAFAAEDIYGRPIAHGLLIQSIATGLASETGRLYGAVVAFRRAEMKFSRATFPGDSVKVKITVKETKANRMLGGGIVTLGFRVINGDGKAVQTGTWNIVIKSKS